MQHAPRILSHEEVKKILDSPDKRTTQGIRDYAILRTLAETGMRRNELSSLDVGNLTTYSGRPAIRYLPEKQRAQSKEKQIPISQQTDKALRKWLKVAYNGDLRDDQPLFRTVAHNSRYDGQRLSGQMVACLVQKYGKKAGLEVVPTTHSFRHAFATGLLEAGVDIETVRELMGHSSLLATQRYVHTSPKKVVDAVDRLDY